MYLLKCLPDIPTNAGWQIRRKVMWLKWLMADGWWFFTFVATDINIYKPSSRYRYCNSVRNVDRSSCRQNEREKKGIGRAFKQITFYVRMNTLMFCALTSTKPQRNRYIFQRKGKLRKYQNYLEYCLKLHLYKKPMNINKSRECCRLNASPQYASSSSNSFQNWYSSQRNRFDSYCLIKSYEMIRKSRLKCRYIFQISSN